MPSNKNMSSRSQKTRSGVNVILPKTNNVVANNIVPIKQFYGDINRRPATKTVTMGRFEIFFFKMSQTKLLEINVKIWNKI